MRSIFIGFLAILSQSWFCASATFRNSIQFPKSSIFLFMLATFSYSLFAAQESIPCNHEYREAEFFRSKYDGFCAGTLVKTPSGYIPIEALHSGDCVLDSLNQPKTIEGLMIRWVPRYWRVNIKDECIGFGIHQTFYTASSDWRIITETDGIVVAGGSVVNLYDVELVEDSTFLYVLTVEDHTFCVTTHDLIAHNAEALVIGAVALVLENFAIPPAVISAIQTTVSLSLISYRALREYCAQQDTLNKDFDEAELYQNTRRAEREYFEKRKQELENLRDEFLIIKNGIRSISAAYNGGISFSSLFFRQQTFPQEANPANLMLMNEMQLPEDQYVTLRIARDMYLSIVEQEIDNLHLVIALHLNEIIENVKKAEIHHWQEATITSKSIDAWNRMCYGTIPADIVFQHYEHCLYDYYSLQKAKQCLEEFKVVVNFYRGQRSRPLLIKTIPVPEILEKMPSLIKKHEEWIEQEHQRITRNIAITEDYYMRNNVNVTHVWPQFKLAFEKQYEEKRKIQLLELQKRQEDLKQKYNEVKKPSGNNEEEPKNPRNNDKYENMYEVFARAPIGKKLKDAVKDAARRYKDSKMYRVIKDVEEFGIKKDDWLYLDKMHKDHIEVFCKKGRPLRTILNMDGTQNLAKIEQAGKRTIEKWIK